MAIFLAVIDRAVAHDPSLSQVERVVDSLVRSTISRYRKYLGRDYVTDPHVVSPTSRGDITLVSWDRTASKTPLSKSDNYWAITSGQNVSNELVTSVRPRGGTLAYSTPIWGQYATVFGTSNRAQTYAWNTVPALEAIHWASTEKYVVISNRQLLVALFRAAARNDQIPDLSSEYLPEYLMYGYSLSGQTPYEGVRTLSVDTALSVNNGSVSLIDTPRGLQSSLAANHTVSEGAEALAMSLENAMDRTEKELAGRKVQLRLSGGKDSRLLVALLRNRAIDVRAVTFGVPANPDVKLATHLCKLSGIGGEVTAPRPMEGESIVDRLEASLWETGGVPASEPHTAQYQGADPRYPGEAIMLGQWPLYKGGLATRMRLSQEEIGRTLTGQGSLMVKSEIREDFDSRLLAWSEGLALSHDLEKLYLFARYFRSGRYLHAHVEQFGRSSMLAYPIADAEVAAVCDALTMYEKVSEKALFGALQHIWTEAVKIPLDRSKWRFELGGPDPAYSGEGYEQRYSKLPPNKPNVKTQEKRVVGEYSKEAFFELARQLYLSPNLSLLASQITESMLTSIAQGAKGVLQVPKGMSMPHLMKNAWRLAVADVWWSRNWLK